MKKVTLATVLLVGSLPLLFSGSTNPAAQQLLVTAKQQASLFHDQPSPIQLDVDFLAQVNAPTQGHLTLKWDQKHSKKGKTKPKTPSSGDCVNRLAQLLCKEKDRSTIRWQHRLKRERPTCTERKNRSSKSADGRVATVMATRQERKTLSNEKTKEPT